MSQLFTLFGNMATAMGGRAVETGKEEYRKKLIAQLSDEE